MAKKEEEKKPTKPYELLGQMLAPKPPEKKATEKGS